MKLKCFYCGRTVNVQYDEQHAAYIAKCTYPRCKLQPETDYEPTEEQVVLDWEMIRESLRG